MIPYTDIGGSGPELRFLHANGYPPACYLPLLDMLKERYHVAAMRLRPLWPGSNPEDLHDWHPLSTDFLQFLDEQGLERAIVIGHSMGGIAALRAALQAPERFQALVLLDPVLFPPGAILLWNLVRALGLGYRLHPLIPAAQKRRRAFDDLERPFNAYRRRPAFRYMSDNALRAYIAGITRPNPQGGYALQYSPDWEARIYYTSLWRDMDLWRGLPNLKAPTLVIRGDETDTFLASTARRVQEANPAIFQETIQHSTHLVPLEKPAQVHQKIEHFLRGNLGQPSQPQNKEK